MSLVPRSELVVASTTVEIDRPIELEPPIVSESAGRPMMLGAIVGIAFFGGLGGWAAFAPLDSAVLAIGTVKVEGNRQTLQHIDGGTVAELLVKEGDTVEQGQVLLRLDQVMLNAQLEVLEGQYYGLKALEARLVAERDGAPRISFDPGLIARRAGSPEIESAMRNQETVFEARNRSFEGQASILRQRINQVREQITGFRSQVRANDQMLVLIKEEAAGVKELFEKGYATKTRLLALERNVAFIEGQRGDQIAQMARANQTIGETELQIVQLDRTRAAEVTEQLRDTQQRLADVEPRLRSGRETIVRTEMRAPTAGLVVGLNVFTVGAVIARGERVLDIVPKDAPLVIEAQIRPEDVDDVGPGMRLEIKMSGYKQRLLPVLHGEVTRVSADRLTDQRSGMPYFALIAQVDRAEFDKLPNVRVMAGMPVEIMIPLRARTALDYVIEPITRNFDRAFRED
jgi:membrane fusion protein, epimerase transport system